MAHSPPYCTFRHDLLAGSEAADLKMLIVYSSILHRRVELAAKRFPMILPCYSCGFTHVLSCLRGLRLKEQVTLDEKKRQQRHRKEYLPPP